MLKSPAVSRIIGQPEKKKNFSLEGKRSRVLKNLCELGELVTAMAYWSADVSVIPSGHVQREGVSFRIWRRFFKLFVSHSDWFWVGKRELPSWSGYVSFRHTQLKDRDSDS